MNKIEQNLQRQMGADVMATHELSQRRVRRADRNWPYLNEVSQSTLRWPVLSYPRVRQIADDGGYLP